MREYGYHPQEVVIRVPRTPNNTDGPKEYDVFVIEGTDVLFYPNINPVRLLRVLETLVFEKPILLDEIPPLNPNQR